MNRLHVRRSLIVLVASAVFFSLVFTVSHLVRNQGLPFRSAVEPESLFAAPGEVPIGGPFTLLDHTGRAVTEADYNDRYLLVFFGYTNCPDVCPTTLGDISVALDMLGTDARQVQTLFISIDPERDTPESMAEYVAAFDPRIVGLTGSPEQIADVASEYRIFYETESNDAYNESTSRGYPRQQPVDDDYLVSHQGQTYLMSPDNKYLTHFNFGSSPGQIAETVQKAFMQFGKPARGSP